MILTSVWDGTSKTRLDPNIFRAPDAADYSRIVKELQETQGATLAIDARFAAEAAAPVRVGKVVRVRTTDGKVRHADSMDTSVAAGISLLNVSAGGVAVFVQAGSLELEDWTEASGAMHLSPGIPYYLGPSGSITSVPVTSGFHIKIGLAISETVLAVKIHDSIRL
jgi:hypothetical protein